jgi:hypothetical protein
MPHLFRLSDEAWARLIDLDDARRGAADRRQHRQAAGVGALYPSI